MDSGGGAWFWFSSLMVWLWFCVGGLGLIGLCVTSLWIVFWILVWIVVTSGWVWVAAGACWWVWFSGARVFAVVFGLWWSPGWVVALWFWFWFGLCGLVCGCCVDLWFVGWLVVW